MEGAVEVTDRYRHNDYEEEKREGCEANDDRGNNAVDSPQILREGSAEESQRTLNQEGRGLHDGIEPPAVDPPQLPFAFPASILDKPPGVLLYVSVEPLFSKRCQKSREKCGTESRIKYGLNLTNAGIWADPARQGDCLAGRYIANGNIEQKL